MSDRFRSRYVELSAANWYSISQLKGDAACLAESIEQGGESRELSLALTKLEECVFWATKHFSAPERQS